MIAIMTVRTATRFMLWMRTALLFIITFIIMVLFIITHEISPCSFLLWNKSSLFITGIIVTGSIMVE